MKVPRSRVDGVSGYRNNVYNIAASYGELDPKKVVCVCLCGSACPMKSLLHLFHRGG